MISNNDQLMLSEAYLKGFLKLEIDEINERIKNLSKLESLELGLVYFTVFKKIIDKDFSLNMNESIFNELLFYSAKWATEKDSKNKMKPKKNSDIKEKRQPVYTSTLIYSIFSFLIRKNNIKSSDFNGSQSLSVVKLELEIHKYLNIIYSLK